MSFGDWLSSSQTSKPLQKAGPLTALTLNDWLLKKKDDFRPENRIHSFTKQAEQLTDEDKYEDAIAMYSKAIELGPTDSSLYCNRSFCHEMVGQFELSLGDAQKAIELSDESVAKLQSTSKDSTRVSNLGKYRNKLMFYRKAKALRHLNLFQESVDALVLSKSLAIECQFIDDEIKDIKLQVICDLGYDRPDLEDVCNRSDSIEELIQLLKQNKRLMITNPAANQLPSNPFRYCGLYVNGLAPDLQQKSLDELLSTCGELIRCKLYSNREQSRAIIAFSDDYSVREAIRTIRSHNEIIRDQLVDNLVIRYRHSCVDDSTDLRTDPQIHFKGTEIGGECFKWRTTGCEDPDCKALHIPLCHHLDQQSIETKCVERKRQPIVFDSGSKSIPYKKVGSSDSQVINGIDSDESSKCLKRVSKTPIVFDVDNKSQSKYCDKRLVSSDPKVIRLTDSSETMTNGLSLTLDSPKNVKQTQRKRIVFDLNDEDSPPENLIDNCLKELKSFEGSHPSPSESVKLNGRSIASYDDLFD